jgi:iduronate 2-sulfatase
MPSPEAIQASALRCITSLMPILSPRASYWRTALILIAQVSTTIGALHSRPNVLFIAVDDLGNVLGSAGHPVAKTPHMDRLAASGVRFDRAYCQIPLCNPSRASVLTGMRPDVIRVYDLTRHFREEKPDLVTLPQYFRQNGWFSARVGKLYHYDVPKGIGTDGLDDKISWDLVINPKGRDVTEEALIINPTPAKPVSAALSWLASEGDDEEQTDGMVATEAIRLLEEQSADKPFFLGVGFFRPHTPFVAPKSYFELHPLDDMRLPSAPPDDRQDMPPAAFAHNNPIPHYDLDEATCRQALQAYHASVSFVDAQIGRVLETLDRLKLADNTIVVLWSDHGYHLGEHLGMWQKRSLLEESARTPLIIRAPGRRGQGRSCNRVVELVDLYPTLTALCGLETPPHLTGRNLQPLLDDPAAEWDAHALTQIVRPADARFTKPVMGRSLRTARWRYTEWNEGREGLELYDHEKDPNEFINLANTPEGKKVIQTLKSLFSRKAEGKVPDSPIVPARL